jgi:hypothetical protein
MNKQPVFPGVSAPITPGSTTTIGQAYPDIDVEGVLETDASITAKARQLVEAGMAVSHAAAALGVRYQHVYQAVNWNRRAAEELQHAAA